MTSRSFLRTQAVIVQQWTVLTGHESAIVCKASRMFVIFPKVTANPVAATQVESADESRNEMMGFFSSLAANYGVGVDAMWGSVWILPVIRIASGRQ